MNKESHRKLLIVGIYAAAMGILEAVVVIYLRYLYYPNGFSFPLEGFIEPRILGVEWVREIATLVMLACIGMLAGKKPLEKFAYFMYSFAIWDIVYYLWLKVVLGWPESLLTWDILFLVPLPWIGPVLAPVIISLTMILFAWIIISANNHGKRPRVSAQEWILLALGSVVILYTFMIDYGALIFNGGVARDFFTLATNPSFMSAVEGFVPQTYRWGLFIIGEILYLAVIYLFWQRAR